MKIRTVIKIENLKKKEYVQPGDAQPIIYDKNNNGMKLLLSDNWKNATKNKL